MTHTVATHAARNSRGAGGASTSFTGVASGTRPPVPHPLNPTAAPNTAAHANRASEMLLMAGHYSLT